MVILTTLSDGIMTNPAFVDMNDFNPYWPMPIGRSPSFTIVGTTMPNMTMCSSDKYWWGGKIEAVMPIPTVGHQRDLGNSLLQSIVTCDKVELKLCRFCLLGGKCQHRAIGLSRNA